MKRVPWLLLALAATTALPAICQPSDRCSPGWSMLNQLREQLSPETPPETLSLLLSNAESRLRNCREIPDLWYYRYLLDQKINKKDDIAYALRMAKELNSDALRQGINPFQNVTPAAAQGPLPKTIREKWALVVGIGQFQDQSHIGALNYTVNDSTAFASLLQDDKIGRFKKDNVVQLVNQQATLLGMRTAIGQLREKVKEDDLLVVYMASHGSPRQSDPNGVSYVLMYDTKLDNAANLYATSLQMVDLVQLLKRDIKARRVVLILDTCYSGDATGARGVQVYSDAAAVGSKPQFSVALNGFGGTDGRVVMSASRADQQSWESDKLKHGYFTYFLMDAMQQDNGMLSIDKVFAAARDKTKAAVAADHPGATQDPTIQESPEGASMILGAPAGAAATGNN